MSSPECEEEIYHKRRSRVYPYLIDNFFPNVHKFQKALRIVYTSNPSGIPEEEKMNMVFAIHCGETKQMDYQYRTYDPNEWKLCKTYLHLKNIPKFLFTSVPSTLVTPEVDNDVTPIDTTKNHNGSKGDGRGKKAAIVGKLKRRRKVAKDLEKMRRINSLRE